MVSAVAGSSALDQDLIKRITKAMANLLLRIRELEVKAAAHGGSIVGSSGLGAEDRLWVVETISTVVGTAVGDAVGRLNSKLETGLADVLLNQFVRYDQKMVQPLRSRNEAIDGRLRELETEVQELRSDCEKMHEYHIGEPMDHELARNMVDDTQIPNMGCREFFVTAWLIRLRRPHIQEVRGPLLMLCDLPAAAATICSTASAAEVTARRRYDVNYDRFEGVDFNDDVASASDWSCSDLCDLTFCEALDRAAMAGDADMIDRLLD